MPFFGCQQGAYLLKVGAPFTLCPTLGFGVPLPCACCDVDTLPTPPAILQKCMHVFLSKTQARFFITQMCFLIAQSRLFTTRMCSIMDALVGTYKSCASLWMRQPHTQTLLPCQPSLRRILRPTWLREGARMHLCRRMSVMVQLWHAYRHMSSEHGAQHAGIIANPT